MKKLNIFDFQQDILIKVEAVKAIGAEIVWSDLAETPDELRDPTLIYQYEEHLFEVCEKNYSGQSYYSQLNAEKYGGFGTGGNGGGSRSLVTPKFVVKGCGKNSLWKENFADKNYNTGHLSIVDASIEVINSFYIDRILPLGSVSLRAIVKVGAKNSCDRVLLLRDHSLRPAHFIPNKGFTDSSIDCSRVKRINRRLWRILQKDKSLLLKEVIDFCEKNAKQFSCARVAGISHGTITPSNFSMDGSWLDLTTATTLSGGETRPKLKRHLLDSDGEFMAPVIILEELLNSFCKFNLLNTEIIANARELYYQRYNHYLGYYSTLYLGIDLDFISERGNYNFFIIEKMLKNCSSSNEDSVNRLLDLFDEIFFNFSKQNIENKELLSWIYLLRDYKEKNISKVSEQSFIKGLFSVSFKRLYLCKFFDSDRILAELYWRYDLGEIKYFSEFIYDAEKFSTWFYSGIRNHKVVIFKKDNFCISYDLERDDIDLKYHGQVLKIPLNDFLTYFLGNYDFFEPHMRICGFDFKEYISVLVSILVVKFSVDE